MKNKIKNDVIYPLYKERISTIVNNNANRYTQRCQQGGKK